MSARGEPLQRAPEKGQPFLLQLPDGESQRIYIEDVPFDFAPMLRIGGSLVPVAPPLRAWEKAITIVPLAGSVLLGMVVGHNGVVPGTVASFAAAAVLRSGFSRIIRTACTLALAATATLVAFRWNVPASRAALRQARQALNKPQRPVWDTLKGLPAPAPGTSGGRAQGEAARPLPAATVFRLRDLLITAEFNSLDAFFDSCSVAAARDVSHEPRLYDAFYAFRAVNPDFEGALNRWIEERPGSFHAHLARATYFVDLAYRERGAKARRSTSRSSFRAMRLALETALSEISAAVRMNPGAVHGYWLAIEIGQGYGDIEGVVLALERALQVSPLSFFSRARAMIALRPRWGGSYDLMLRVAAMADSLRPHNPELGLLPGFVAWDLGNAAWLRADTALAQQYLDEAMASGPTFWFCSERGELRVKLRQVRAALPDLDCAVSLRPANSEAHLYRSKALYAVAYAQYPSDWKLLLGDADTEAKIAFGLDSLDEKIRRNHEFVAKQRNRGRPSS